MLERTHVFLLALTEVSILVVGTSVILLIAAFVVDHTLNRILRAMGVWWAFVYFLVERRAIVKRYGTDAEVKARHEVGEGS